MKTLLLIVLVIVFCAWLEEVWAKPIAELRVSPRWLLSRGDIHVVVALKSGAPLEGRWYLRWEADGGIASSTRSDIEDDGQRTWDVWLKSYPPAAYRFDLTVVDADGKEVAHESYDMGATQEKD